MYLLYQKLCCCLIQNKKNISTFLSTFGIIKPVLSSYEVNIKLETIDKLLCRRLKSSKKKTLRWQLSMFTSYYEVNNCILLYLININKDILAFYRNKSVPIVSYSYTNSIGRKNFNYKEALQNFSIEEHRKNPLTCDCCHSPFQYNPSGHVITGDLNIIQHESPKGDFSWS